MEKKQEKEILENIREKERNELSLKVDKMVFGAEKREGFLGLYNNFYCEGVIIYSYLNVLDIVKLQRVCKRLKIYSIEFLQSSGFSFSGKYILNSIYYNFSELLNFYTFYLKNNYLSNNFQLNFSNMIGETEKKKHNVEKLDLSHRIQILFNLSSSYNFDFFISLMKNILEL